jgi:hypothetical protein
MERQQLSAAADTDTKRIDQQTTIIEGWLNKTVSVRKRFDRTPLSTSIATLSVYGKAATVVVGGYGYKTDRTTNNNNQHFYKFQRH